jgi:hypothetical protein
VNLRAGGERLQLQQSRPHENLHVNVLLSQPGLAPALLAAAGGSASYASPSAHGLQFSAAHGGTSHSISIHAIQFTRGDANGRQRLLRSRGRSELQARTPHSSSTGKIAQGQPISTTREGRVFAGDAAAPQQALVVVTRGCVRAV